MSIPMPTPAQIRAARNFFGWTQEEAAPRFDIGQSTLVDLERGHRDPNSVTRGKIGISLLQLGILFTDEGNMILPPEPVRS